MCRTFYEGIVPFKPTAYGLHNILKRNDLLIARAKVSSCPLSLPPPPPPPPTPSLFPSLPSLPVIPPCPPEPDHALPSLPALPPCPPPPPPPHCPLSLPCPPSLPSLPPCPTGLCLPSRKKRIITPLGVKTGASRPGGSPSLLAINQWAEWYCLIWFLMLSPCLKQVLC